MKGRVVVRNRKPRPGQAPFSVTIEAPNCEVFLECVDRVNAALQAHREQLIALSKSAPGGRLPRSAR